MKTIKGAFLKKVIANNKLSTAKKYEAFRKANASLSLPNWQQVVEAHNECGGWNFEVRGDMFRATAAGGVQ